jgi:hypothetical protein
METEVAALGKPCGPCSTGSRVDGVAHQRGGK